MKFEFFEKDVGVPYFSSGFLRQLFPDVDRSYLALQLVRWCAAGRLVCLRRGVYAFADRKGDFLPGLGNVMVGPSYLSGHWALGHYGMIPEAVWEFTSACLVAPRRRVWETPFGRFSFRQVKFFRGFERVELGEMPVLLAVAEKALLDAWYWAGGEWTVERHREMRYENLEHLNEGCLKELCAGFESPRLDRAVESFFVASMEGGRLG